MQSALSGAPPPPLPDAPGGADRDATTAARVSQGAWAAGAASAALFLWGLGGALRALLPAAALPWVVAAMALSAAAVAGLLVGRAVHRRQGGDGRPLVEPLAASLTLLLALSIAGHLMHPRGAPLRPLMPDAFPPAASALVLLVGLMLAPLLGGLAERGATQALDVSGASPWRPRLHGAAGLAKAWLSGLRLPGLLALDVLLTLTGAARRGLRKEVRHRLHADVRLDELADAARAHGYDTHLRPDGALELTREASEGRVAQSRVLARRDRLAFPRAQADRVLHLDGEDIDVRALRRALDPRLLADARWAWSAPARRLEAQLDALHEEAQEARSLETRASLLHAVDALARALPHRRLLQDEHALLQGWKLPAVRAHLEALVDAPAAPPGTRVALAPAPALAPRLDRLLDVGGLRAAERLTYVPYALVPVRTRHGEVEVLVNAITEDVDPAETLALLDAVHERAPRLHAEGHRPVFLPPPTPTAALVNRAREAVRRSRGGRTHADPDAVERLYVPFVRTDDGWTNAVTGAESPALAKTLQRAESGAASPA